MHDGFESDDALGRWVRIDGDWRWRDGKLITLVRSGGLALFDELDSARPEMLARIHSLLENPRQISLPEHLAETITACPGFGFIATANPPGGGGRELAPRMVDRFGVRLPFDYDEAIERRLCPDVSVLSAFRSLRRDSRVHSPLSTRLLVQYNTNRGVYGPGVALQLLLNGFEPDEREVASEAFASLAHARPTPHSPPTLRVGGPKK